VCTGSGLLSALVSFSSLAALSLHHTDCASVDFFGWSSGEAPVERSYALACALEVQASADIDDSFMIVFAEGAELVDVLAETHLELMEALRR